jgi:hypothetical protein
MEMEEPMPRMTSKTLSLDIRRMASIEHDTCPREGHALSPTERAVIMDAVPALEKKLMYSTSLRKRSLDVLVADPAAA